MIGLTIFDHHGMTYAQLFVSFLKSTSLAVPPVLMAATPPKSPPGSLEKKLFGDNVWWSDYQQGHTPFLTNINYKKGYRSVGVGAWCTQWEWVCLCHKVRFHSFRSSIFCFLSRDASHRMQLLLARAFWHCRKDIPWSIIACFYWISTFSFPLSRFFEA